MACLRHSQFPGDVGLREARVKEFAHEVPALGRQPPGDPGVLDGLGPDHADPVERLLVPGTLSLCSPCPHHDNPCCHVNPLVVSRLEDIGPGGGDVEKAGRRSCSR